MIDLNYITVEGYCNTTEELEKYLENLKLLPSRIISWEITPNMPQLLEFKVVYIPLKI